jgi:hypothetical protein
VPSSPGHGAFVCGQRLCRRALWRFVRSQDHPRASAGCAAGLQTLISTWCAHFGSKSSQGCDNRSICIHVCVSACTKSGIFLLPALEVPPRSSFFFLQENNAPEFEFSSLCWLLRVLCICVLVNACVFLGGGMLELQQMPEPKQQGTPFFYHACFFKMLTLFSLRWHQLLVVT